MVTSVDTARGVYQALRDHVPADRIGILIKDVGRVKGNKSFVETIARIAAIHKKVMTADAADLDVGHAVIADGCVVGGVVSVGLNVTDRPRVVGVKFSADGATRAFPRTSLRRATRAEVDRAGPGLADLVRLPCADE
jgi:hypothetical protein